MKATAPRRAARPEPGLYARQALLHRAQEHPQGRALEVGVAAQEVAQPLRHRQHPLPHWQAWEDVIGQMRRRLHHAPRIARRAYATSLAGDPQPAPKYEFDQRITW